MHATVRVSCVYHACEIPLQFSDFWQFDTLHFVFFQLPFDDEHVPTLFRKIKGKPSPFSFSNVSLFQISNLDLCHSLNLLWGTFFLPKQSRRSPVGQCFLWIPAFIYCFCFLWVGVVWPAAKVRPIGKQLWQFVKVTKPRLADKEGEKRKENVGRQIPRILFWEISRGNLWPRVMSLLCFKMSSHQAMVAGCCWLITYCETCLLWKSPTGRERVSTCLLNY